MGVSFKNMQLLTSPTISVAYAFEELLYLIHFLNV